MSTTKTSKVAIQVLNGPPAGSFASTLVVSGSTIYLAGMVGIGSDGKFVEGTIQDRTKQALRNAEICLGTVGLDLSDVVSAQIFLSHYKQDFALMNEAYVSCFPKDAPLPVRTCVGVADLPAGTDIEMTLIAASRQ